MRVDLPWTHGERTQEASTNAIAACLGFLILIECSQNNLGNSSQQHAVSLKKLLVPQMSDVGDEE